MGPNPLAAETPQADLSLTVGDTPDPVQAGATFSYVILVTNRGPSDATGLTVIGNLSPGVNFAAASWSGGSCSYNGSDHSVTCTLAGSLPVDQTAPDIVVTVRAVQVGSLTSTFSVTANEPDPNTSNNVDSEMTTVPQADLAVA